MDKSSAQVARSQKLEVRSQNSEARGAKHNSAISQKDVGGLFASAILNSDYWILST